MASAAAQACLSLPWSQTPKTGFLVTWLTFILGIVGLKHLPGSSAKGISSEFKRRKKAEMNKLEDTCRNN